MTTQRVHVSKDTLFKVVNELRERGHNNKSITKEIGARIDSYLYYENNMSLEALKRLENLYGNEIKHSIIENEIKLEKSRDLAELFGIILGDGHIQQYSENKNGVYKGSYFIEITLNSNEHSLIDRTKNLLLKETDQKPKMYPKRGDCIRLVIHSKKLTEELLKLGLKSGNKLENKVEVPDWIKSNENYCKACIKGLIDTDGSIYIDNREKYNYTRIQFTNYSQPLLEDFKKMCEDIGIQVVKGGPHQLQISLKDINRFFEIINPIKATHTS